MIEALVTIIMVCGLYGAATSFFQEQLEWLQRMLGGPKISNMVINILVPALVAVFGQVWIPEFGDLDAFVLQLATVLVPLSTFLFSQLAHGLNKNYNIVKKSAKNK